MHCIPPSYTALTQRDGASAHFSITVPELGILASLDLIQPLVCANIVMLCGRVIIYICLSRGEVTRHPFEPNNATITEN